MILTILAIIANSGDYFTTLIGFKYGCREANPIGRWLFKVPLLAFFVKMILVNYWIFMGSKYLHIIASIIFGLCVINNIIQTIKMRRRLIWIRNQYNLSSLGEALQLAKESIRNCGNDSKENS